MEYYKNYFDLNPEERQDPQESSSGDKKGISRRDLIKGVLVVGAAAAARKVIERLNNDEPSSAESTADTEQAADISREMPPDELEKISAQDILIKNEVREEREIIAQSIVEALEFRQEGRIIFNEHTVKKIQKDFREKFMADASYARAYTRLGRWKPALLKIFNKYDIPEELLFLAMPESHFMYYRLSPAGADGPYQFMPNTGREYGLAIGEQIDQRHDPLVSGEACAKYLKWLHGRTGDWDLPLSGYNGGQYKRYMKTLPKGEKPTYPGFCAYLEDRVNEKRDEVVAMKEYFYTIKEKDTLESIAKKFHLFAEELASKNKISANTPLFAGKSLDIPITDESIKAIFTRKISGLIENMAYPAKFHATMDLINAGYFKQRQPVWEFSTFLEIKEKRGSINYQLGRWEKIEHVMKKFKVSWQALQTANKGLNLKKLSAGQSVVVPNQVMPTTLKSLAHEYNIEPEENLFDCNPAVKPLYRASPLPLGFIVRIPKNQPSLKNPKK
jgi:soluble lytic murein transglycosylase-like protein